MPLNVQIATRLLKYHTVPAFPHRSFRAVEVVAIATQGDSNAAFMVSMALALRSTNVKQCLILILSASVLYASRGFLRLREFRLGKDSRDFFFF